ncbi:hypothetical protein ACX801_18265 [Arthrobacter bambusae]
MADELDGWEWIPPETPAFVERWLSQFQLLYDEGVAERRQRKADGADTRLYDETLGILSEIIETFWDMLTVGRVWAFAKEHGTGPYTIDELSAVTEIGTDRLQSVVDQLVAAGIVFLD